MQKSHSLTFHRPKCPCAHYEDHLESGIANVSQQSREHIRRARNEAKGAKLNPYDKTAFVNSDKMWNLRDQCQRCGLVTSPVHMLQDCPYPCVYCGHAHPDRLCVNHPRHFSQEWAGPSGVVVTQPTRGFARERAQTQAQAQAHGPASQQMVPASAFPGFSLNLPGYAVQPGPPLSFMPHASGMTDQTHWQMAPQYHPMLAQQMPLPRPPPSGWSAANYDFQAPANFQTPAIPKAPANFKAPARPKPAPGSRPSQSRKRSRQRRNTHKLESRLAEQRKQKKASAGNRNLIAPGTSIAAHPKPVLAIEQHVKTPDTPGMHIKPINLETSVLTANPMPAHRPLQYPTREPTLAERSKLPLRGLDIPLTQDEIEEDDAWFGEYMEGCDDEAGERAGEAAFAALGRG
ncbi:hypothetical protein EJ05DRAFT_513120 [Pseudovirgaria hyperparasitica]|uniref:Uncharacterized protein n=1 Tax=Pseudovirgaria hyperparasitica TaxID=470096 RepID=A0A6A6VZA3_9PEZI|nr:uncharacterized protein EJ05DRAFT_513120 [Pseudovirgaria hyperparasitica]KAF2755633.1 hypothetical protein EJ05DRAFT_513120 [Pseudovirgaria hyperparasitica]